MKNKLGNLVEEIYQSCDGNLLEMFQELTENFQELPFKQLVNWVRILENSSLYGSSDSLLDIPMDEKDLDFRSYSEWLVELGRRFYSSLQEDPKAERIHHLAKLLGADCQDLIKAPVFAYIKSLGEDHWNSLMYGGKQPSIFQDRGESRRGDQMESTSHDSCQTFGRLCLLFYLCTAVKSRIVV